MNSPPPNTHLPTHTNGIQLNPKSHIALASLILLAGCSATNRVRSISFGEIALPTPETKLTLGYTKDDLTLLGEVNITRTFLHNTGENIGERMLKSVEFKNIGQLASGVPVLVSGNAALAGSVQDGDINELVFDVYSKYPEIDYLVFPKILIESIRSNNPAAMDTVHATIKGTAAKLKVK